MQSFNQWTSDILFCSKSCSIWYQIKLYKELNSGYNHVSILNYQTKHTNKVNFEIYEIATWLTNNCKTLIDQQFQWQFLITNSGFWLVNILLGKFDTSKKKENYKNTFFWWKATKKCQQKKHTWRESCIEKRESCKRKLHLSKLIPLTNDVSCPNI